jgi:hypothetical protein
MWELYPSIHHGNGNILSCDSKGHPHASADFHIDADKYWNLFFNNEPPNF